jgi:mitochondrial import inner membrane translocase subunit TIM21
MATAARTFQLACRARLRSSAAKPSVGLLPLPGVSHSLGGGTASSTSPARKAVTVTSDDGRYRWSELSTREKAARSTQQSINMALVVAGAVGTVHIHIVFLVEMPC